MRTYKNEIVRIIKYGKSVHNFSISDYLDPIKDLYSNLSYKEKKNFQSSLLSLLNERNFVSEIAVICRQLKIKQVAPSLMEIFLNPPQNTQDGHPIWIEGLRKTMIASLGELRSKEARVLLINLLDEQIYKNEHNLPRLKQDSYGIVMQALTKISPNDAAKFFGRWISQDRDLRLQTMNMVKKTNDWEKLRELNITLPIDEHRSSSIEECILTVAKKGKLEGLKKWLKAIKLLKEQDRDALKYNLEYMLNSEDEMYNLRKILKFKGTAKSLAIKLASLPFL